MTAAQIALTVLLAVVVLAIGVAVGVAMRRRELRRRFGPEYERAVDNADSRISAERELINREKRHAELDLKDIDPDSRTRYADEWRAVQAQFVTDPQSAVVAGDDLVTRLVAERGYPSRDHDDQLSVLSVEHARTLGNYRDAHEIYVQSQRGEATTEDLRRAFVHYRALFADLLDEKPSTIVDSASVDNAPTRG